MRSRHLLVFLVAAAACHGSPVSWPRPEGTLPAANAEVHTLNAGYHRGSSQVLVRSIDRPTRANLDWAAYHANFMIAEAPAEGDDAGASGLKPDTSHAFAGALETATLTSTIQRTPLTEDERLHPLALAPLIEFLSARSPALATGLEEVAAAVRSETWGLGGGGAIAHQLAAEAFLHQGGAGALEVWVKVEVQPWWKGLGALPDEDGDGVPEIYGRVESDKISEETLRVIRDDYAGKLLSPAEIKRWSNQLSSYWYPSYNTDLLPPPPRWPTEETEAPIRKELGDAHYTAPTILLRGKPQGVPTYNVFLVSEASATASADKPHPPRPPLEKSTPSARPAPVVATIDSELAAHGGSFARWSTGLAPFRETVQAKLKATPPKITGLPGADGFLFFRSELDYVVGGDLTAQPRGKNPLPIIVEFKKALAARGVDFLFVPVPNKVEVLPDRLDRRQASLVGQVVNPWQRKLLADLGHAGVEVIDLLPPFLADRQHDARTVEPLYQAQDTHWTARGLELAARLVAARVRQYPWYPALAKGARHYDTKDAPFNRYGDLHSRLADAQKAHYQPEKLTGHQVVGPDGALYEDDPDSPIVVLGDSFTGVYELTECEHAGVSAHLARELGTPIDLVMSYGGGPNVRQKLLRRGAADLANKRLVVWMMTARDLYNYWEDWEPLQISAAR